MSNKSLAIVILAAGKGTRMKSDKPKVMHELAGKPMINWLIETCEQLNPAKIITVIGPDMDDLAAAVTPHETAIQENRNGTGGAVKCALPALDGFDGDVLIVMGDEPLVQIESLQALIEEGGLTVQGFDTLTPAGLGRMVLNNDGTLHGIVEDADCNDAQKQISLCNAGNYCVPADKLAGWIEQIGDDNAQGEVYLTDLPAIAAKDGVPTKVIRGTWIGPWGINDRVQLSIHEKMLQIRLREQALHNGVSMIDPDSVYFHYDTKIGVGSVIEPNVFFGAGVSIDEGVTIKAFSHIEDTHIKANVAVGPFARLRGGSTLGENVKIGNFVELKNAQLAEGVKASHLSYLGDAEIGENSNIGAGTITCNYNGFEKNKTQIGENVFIGSNSSLVAPIKIEDGALIAAGSSMTEDVPKDALGIARAETKVKEGWAARFRKLKAAGKAAVLIGALIGAAIPALACEGFKNSISALEAVVAQHQRQAAATPKKQTPLPHTTSLNQDLDALEEALRDHYAKQAAVKPKKPKTPPIM